MDLVVNFKSAISENMLWIKLISISREIALRWMRQNVYDDKLTLVHVKAWCRHGTSQYEKMLNQGHGAIWRK